MTPIKIISENGDTLPDGVSNKYPKAMKMLEHSLKKKNGKMPTIIGEYTLDAMERAIVGNTDIQSTEDFFNDNSFEDYECTTYKFINGKNIYNMD